MSPPSIDGTANHKPPGSLCTLPIVPPPRPLDSAILPPPTPSEWRAFPDPRSGQTLDAPIGAGVYEMRMGTEWVLVGKAKCVAARMCSLLPEPWGTGTRRNGDKRDYVFRHLGSIQYRCYVCPSEAEAFVLELALRRRRSYRFPT